MAGSAPRRKGECPPTPCGGNSPPRGTTGDPVFRALTPPIRPPPPPPEGGAKGTIGAGVVVLLGVGKDDTPETAAYLAEKTAHLRIINDPQGKMNLSLLDSGGAALVVSQFTLYGDTRHGRRPAFDRAAP